MLEIDQDQRAGERPELVFLIHPRRGRAPSREAEVSGLAAVNAVRGD